MNYEKQEWINGVTKVTAEKMTHIEDGIYRLGLLLHPVGSIYMSLDTTEPSTLFGGTWERIEGRFLLGAGSNGADLYTEVGNIGGEASHQLTIQEMPAHNHTDASILTANNLKTALPNYGANTNATGYYYEGAEVGGNQPHNNMPPYLSVNMWKRVS